MLYDIGFHSGPFSRQPVHEHLTIAALIRSDVKSFTKDSTYDNLSEEQWVHTFDTNIHRKSTTGSDDMCLC